MSSVKEHFEEEILAIDPCRAAIATLILENLRTIAANSGGDLGEISAQSIFNQLEKPPEPTLGDYAFPCFRFAKGLKSKPNDIAASLAAKINENAPSPTNWHANAVAAGAFCNIFANKTMISQFILPRVLNSDAFKSPGRRVGPQKQRVMIEYSQPNTHKEFHVGHARNVCLGSALVNMYRYCGYPVIAANYFGDEGTHIAKCIWYIRRTKANAPATGRGEWLGMQYAAASRLLSEASGADREQMDREVSEVLRAIESKSGEIFDYWLTTRKWSLDEFDSIYKWFGVSFERLFYESEVSEDSQKIVDEYLNKGVFIQDDGAIGIDLKAHKLGFMLVRKRDGNTLYATKDLVLARRKFEEYKIDRSIYVVAHEQTHHFKQVFKTLEIMGFEQAKRCFHLAYGMVVLPDGKMSSRDGTSVTFNALRSRMLEALGTHLAKYRGEWSDAEIESCANALCNGAVRYGMLSTDAVKDVVFDIDHWLSYEGNSGPYLMYSYTRTKSILRRAAEAGYGTSHTALQNCAFHSLTDPLEHDLLRYIYDFNDTVISATENFRPSTIATHLFYMCKAFNRFYADIPVLKGAHAEIIEARLALIAAFAATLRQGLALLGIEAPERM